MTHSGEFSFLCKGRSGRLTIKSNKFVTYLIRKILYASIQNIMGLAEYHLLG